MRIRTYILSLFILIILFLQANLSFGQTNAKDIQNPKTISLSNWVNNQDKLLSDSTIKLLNDKLNQLYDSTSCQMAIVIINGEKETDARELSMQLFNLWHPGKKGQDNGIIMLVVANAHKAFIRTGYGIEGTLTDALCTRIITKKMIPYFKENKWDEGIINGTNAVLAYLYNDSTNENITKQEAKEEGFSLSDILAIYLAFGFMLGVFAIYFILSSTRNIDKAFRSKRVNTLSRNYRIWISSIAIFSWWLIPIINFFYKQKKNHIRKEKVICDCGSQMHLLSEKQEDEFLTNVQQLEETLGTRNYDVWLCSKCGKTIIYAYEEKSSYKDCPKCKAKTYKLESEQIIHTHSLTGKDILRKNYICKNCGHRHSQDSFMDNSSSFFTGGAIAGGMMSSGSSSFGGGFSGGNFGGGFSGGGGGGGSW